VAEMEFLLAIAAPYVGRMSFRTSLLNDSLEGALCQVVNPLHFLGRLNPREDCTHGEFGSFLRQSGPSSLEALELSFHFLVFP
jgi:hypothetical protein